MACIDELRELVFLFYFPIIVVLPCEVDAHLPRGVALHGLVQILKCHKRIGFLTPFSLQCDHVRAQTPSVIMIDNTHSAVILLTPATIQ